LTVTRRSEVKGVLLLAILAQLGLLLFAATSRYGSVAAGVGIGALGLAEVAILLRGNRRDSEK
jgi:hypothetical protein